MIESEPKQPRACPRFSLDHPVRLRACPLPLLPGANSQSRAVEGRIQNISSGGLCVLTRQPLTVSEILWGEIALPGTHASVPTLLQVRWRRRNAHGSGHCAGLRFVLQDGISYSLRTPANA